MKRWLMIFELLLCLGYMGTIFYLSSQPMPAMFVLPISQIDKLYHFVAFGILGALGCQVGSRWTQHLYWQIWLGGMVASLFGISDEWHQLFVPGRSSGIDDVIADICGGWTGAIVWGLWLSPYYERLTSWVRKE